MPSSVRTTLVRSGWSVNQRSAIAALARPSPRSMMETTCSYSSGRAGTTAAEP
jgi:hypothetical protein